MALSGRATIDARITGDVRDPSVVGSATLANVGLGISDPRVAVSGLSGRVTFGQNRLVVDAKGNLNGGDVEVTGTLPVFPLAKGETPPSGLRARGKSFLVEWPEGLRSSLDADVTYRVDAQGGILTGRVDVEPGAYRRATPPKLSTSPGTGAGGALARGRHSTRPVGRDAVARSDGQQLRATRGGGQRARGRHHRAAGDCGTPAGTRGRRGLPSRQRVQDQPRQPGVQARSAVRALGRHPGRNAAVGVRHPASDERAPRRPPDRADLGSAAGPARPDGTDHDRQHVELDEPWRHDGSRTGRARRRHLQRHPRPGRQDGGPRQRPRRPARTRPDGRRRRSADAPHDRQVGRGLARSAALPEPA